MGMNLVDSGHLLIALSIEGEGIAAHVLKDLGADQQTVVGAVRRLLGARGVEQRRFRRRLLGISDVETLERLFGIDYIADLLRAKGLDIESLANQLLDPPDDVRQLRRDLVVLRAELAALPIDESEEAAKLEQDVSDLVLALQEAEERWLESLIDR